MNILFYFENQINPFRGGTERVAYLISNYLKQQGHTIFYLAKYKVEDEYSVESFILPNTRIGSAANMSFINKMISDYNINIIVNEGGNSDDIYFFSKEILPARVKIITCLHFNIKGDLDHYYKSINFNLNHIPFLEGLKNYLRISISPVRKYIHIFNRKRRYRYMYQYSDKVVLLTDSYVADYKQFIGENEEDSKFEVLPNPNTFNMNKEVFVSEKKKQLLFVGRLDYASKRVDRILKVWELLQTEFQDWSLIIIGDGPDYNRLTRIVAKQKIQRVFFTGFVDPTRYFSESKILLLTSNFEGSPMVIPEAMSWGVVPVVMNSFSGASIHVKHNYNGILVSPFNIDLYARVLRSLMISSDLDRYSHNSVLSVNDFDIEVIGQRWLRLIDEIIQ